MYHINKTSDKEWLDFWKKDHEARYPETQGQYRPKLCGVEHGYPVFCGLEIYIKDEKKWVSWNYYGKFKIEENL